MLDSKIVIKIYKILKLIQVYQSKRLKFKPINRENSQRLTIDHGNKILQALNKIKERQKAE
jgi:hypothetical protein